MKLIPLPRFVAGSLPSGLRPVAEHHPDKPGRALSLAGLRAARGRH